MKTARGSFSQDWNNLLATSNKKKKTLFEGHKLNRWGLLLFKSSLSSLQVYVWAAALPADQSNTRLKGKQLKYTQCFLAVSHYVLFVVRRILVLVCILECYLNLSDWGCSVSQTSETKEKQFGEIGRRNLLSFCGRSTIPGDGHNGHPCFR